MSDEAIHKENYPVIKSEAILRDFQLYRIMEAFFWTLLVFFVCLISTVKDWVFCTFPYLSCLPLINFVFLSFRLPNEHFSNKLWADYLRELKIFSLLAVFNFPFLVFLVKGTVNEYFKWCAIISLYALFKVLKTFLKIIVLGAETYGDRTLVKEAKLAKFFLNSAVCCMLLLTYIYFKEPMSFSYFMALEGPPGIIRLVILIFIIFPLIFPLTLLFRFRSLVCQDYVFKIEKLICQKQN